MKEPPARARARPWTRFRVAFYIVAVLTALVLEWTLVSWLKDVALAALGVRLLPYVSRLIDFVLSLVLFGVAMSLLGRYFGSRHIDFFTTITDALSRIARGDFSVSVPLDQIGEPSPDNRFRAVAENLNQMAEALKKMEAMRQEFISNVSHEIQSPLTSIRGFAQAIREGGLSEEVRAHYLSMIETETRRLSRLCENLLRLSSLDSKAHTPERKPYRLDSQIRSVVLAAEPQWTAKEIDVSADLDPVVIEADEDMMNQVFTNLAHNAVKFTPPGGTIHIELLREDGQHVVRLTDSGIGIAPEDLPFVFDRFYKADKARTRDGDAGGSGLGLAITKTIIGLHGGQIDVKSEGPGRGACFTVTLPAPAA